MMRAPDHSLYLKLTLQVFRISTFLGHVLYTVEAFECNHTHISMIFMGAYY